MCKVQVTATQVHTDIMSERRNDREAIAGSFLSQCEVTTSTPTTSRAQSTAIKQLSPDGVQSSYKYKLHKYQQNITLEYYEGED